MALKNPNTNEYLKITNFHFDEQSQFWNIGYLIFADKEQRDRWENGLSNYERTESGLYNGAYAQIEMNKNADNAITILNNVKRGGYEALKNDMFENWIDA